MSSYPPILNFIPTLKERIGVLSEVSFSNMFVCWKQFFFLEKYGRIVQCLQKYEQMFVVMNCMLFIPYFCLVLFFSFYMCVYICMCVYI